MAELEISTGGAKHAKDANQRSQPAAVQVAHFAELQNDVLRQLGEFVQFELKKAYLITADDAAAASHDDNFSHVVALQGELHGGVKTTTFSADTHSWRGWSWRPTEEHRSQRDGSYLPIGISNGFDNEIMRSDLGYQPCGANSFPWR